MRSHVFGRKSSNKFNLYVTCYKIVKKKTPQTKDIMKTKHIRTYTHTCFYIIYKGYHILRIVGRWFRSSKPRPHSPNILVFFVFSERFTNFDWEMKKVCDFDMHDARGQVTPIE